MKTEWFLEEVSKPYHWQRVNTIIDIKEYLSGRHKILSKLSYQFNGQTYEPRKIVLQYAKTVINYGIGYVISNPITLTGDQKVTDEYKRIYKRGKYNSLDYDVMDKMSKFGFVAEYVFLDDGQQIKSKLLDSADSYPVFNHKGEYTAFIESWAFENITYYNIYYPEIVEQWSDEGGTLHKVEEFNNLSGLPILYCNQSETDVLGRSDLLDLLPILDNLEDLLSKSTDAFYHFTSGIPVLKGQQLTGAGIPRDVVGGGIVIDDNADFFFAQNKFDHQAFETLYKTLSSVLLDIANVPAVSMSKTDISNLSEVTMRLLFSLADMRGQLNAKYLRQGIEQRFDVFRRLLKLKGVEFTDDEYDSLGLVFHFARPSNDKETVENLTALKDAGLISLESAVERNPYVTDVSGELEKIGGHDDKAAE